jgi:DNA-binding transcriptional LysR family regulator
LRIDLRHLQAFQAVAEELHFRRAAERLHVAQPALSRTIQQLEESIGEVLLLRSNRRVELTEAGRAFLTGSRAVFERLDIAVELARKAGAGLSGQLSIGYTDFAISGELPSILDGFRRQHPKIRTELIYASTQQQLIDLTQGNIDFGLVTGPIQDQEFDSIAVQHDRFVAVLPQRHPLASQSEVLLEDLAHDPFVMGFMHRWTHFRRHLDALCVDAGFLPNIVQEAYNSEGVFGFVAANIGVSIHAECASNISRKGVVLRPLKGIERKIVTEVAWVKDTVTPIQQTFIDFLRQWKPAT